MMHVTTHHERKEPGTVTPSNGNDTSNGDQEGASSTQRNVQNVRNPFSSPDLPSAPHRRVTPNTQPSRPRIPYKNSNSLVKNPYKTPLRNQTPTRNPYKSRQVESEHRSEGKASNTSAHLRCAPRKIDMGGEAMEKPVAVPQTDRHGEKEFETEFRCSLDDAALCELMENVERRLNSTTARTTSRNVVGTPPRIPNQIRNPYKKRGASRSFRINSDNDCQPPEKRRTFKSTPRKLDMSDGLDQAPRHPQQMEKPDENIGNKVVALASRGDSSGLEENETEISFDSLDDVALCELMDQVEHGVKATSVAAPVTTAIPNPFQVQKASATSNSGKAELRPEKIHTHPSTPPSGMARNPYCTERTRRTTFEKEPTPAEESRGEDTLEADDFSCSLDDAALCRLMENEEREMDRTKTAADRDDKATGGMSLPVNPYCSERPRLETNDREAAPKIVTAKKNFGANKLETDDFSCSLDDAGLCQLMENVERELIKTRAAESEPSLKPQATPSPQEMASPYKQRDACNFRMW